MAFPGRGLRHLLVQLAAFCVAWFWWSPVNDPLPFLLADAALALLIASYSRMALLLRLGHMLFLPVAALALSLGLPAWYYLVGFLLLFALCRNAVSERVPLYLSSVNAAEAVVRLLPTQARLLDLGCGNGKLVFAAARARPDIHVVGVENAILPWLAAKAGWFVLGGPRNVQIRYGNMWAMDWRDYDAIYAFLSPAPMSRVWAGFQANARAGCMLISNSFAIDGVEPDEVLPLDGHLQKALLIWRKK